MEILTTQSVLEAVLSRDPEKRALYDRLNLLVERFEAGVWQYGWRYQNLKQKDRGMRQGRMTAEERLIEDEPETRVQILSYTIAGRTMLTLRRAEVELSMVADETATDSRTGFQGCQGTEPELERLVEDAVQQWQGRPIIEPDVDVHLAGLPG